MVGDAPEEYNTLGEVMDYMQEHIAEAESRDERIDENTDAIKDINEKLTTIDPTGSG